MCTVVDAARKRAGVAHKLRDAARTSGLRACKRQETARILALQKVDASWAMGPVPQQVIEEEEDEDEGMMASAQDVDTEKTPVATEK